MKNFSQYFLGEDNFWYIINISNKDGWIKKLNIKLKNKNKDYLKQFDLKKIEETKNISITTSSNINGVQLNSSTFLGYNSFYNFNFRKDFKEIALEGMFFHNLISNKNNFLLLGFRRTINKDFDIKLGYKKMMDSNRHDIFQAILNYKFKIFDINNFNFLLKLENNLDNKNSDLNMNILYNSRIKNWINFSIRLNLSVFKKFNSNFVFSGDIFKNKNYNLHFFLEKGLMLNNTNCFLFFKYILDDDFKIYSKINSKKVLDFSTVSKFKNKLEFINSFRLDFDNYYKNFFNYGIGIKINLD
jgi:hypothetical protein